MTDWLIGVKRRVRSISVSYPRLVVFKEEGLSMYNKKLILFKCSFAVKSPRWMHSKVEKWIYCNKKIFFQTHQQFCLRFCILQVCSRSSEFDQSTMIRWGKPRYAIFKFCLTSDTLHHQALPYILQSWICVR